MTKKPTKNNQSATVLQLNRGFDAPSKETPEEFSERFQVFAEKMVNFEHQSQASRQTTTTISSLDSMSQKNSNFKITSQAKEDKGELFDFARPKDKGE